MTQTELPLWPGERLADRYPQGWVAIRPDRMADLPKGAVGSGVPVRCGQSCAVPGFPPVICSDHGDGYHAAAVASTFGPRIIAVWLDEALDGGEPS